MKKRKGWLLVLVISLVVLIGIIANFLKEDNKPKIVVVLKVLDSEYWKIFKSGAEKAFDDFNVDGRVIAPDSMYPITKQSNMLKSVLEEQPDALIVTPSYPSVIIPALEEYKKKNIPVLLADTDVKWEDKITYIGTDNFALGKRAGELLASILYPGDQVALIGGISNSVMSERLNGAKEALTAVGIEIVTEQSGYDKFGNIKTVMKNISQIYPDIKGVIAADDLMALDALKVIEKKGLNIPVVGVDGTSEMVKYVERGKLNATLAQNPYDMGYLSVEQASKAIEGENVIKRVNSGVNIITQDNAKDKLDFLTEILHLREGVVKNF